MSKTDIPEAQFAPEVPNEAIDAIQAIKSQYADPIALTSLRSTLCRKLNIVDLEADEDSATTPDTAVTGTRTVTKDLFGTAEPIEDKDKFHNVLNLISYLKDIIPDLPNGGNTRSVVSGNQYIAHFDSLFKSLKNLGLELSDVIQGNLDQTRIEQAVFEAYTDGLINQAMEDESEPDRVGTYKPASGHMMPAIDINMGRKGRYVDAFKILEGALDGDTRSQQHAEKNGTYREVVKLHCINLFKEILASHYEINYENFRKTSQVVKFDLMYFGGDTHLGHWMRQLHKYGLKPADVLGMELDQFFQIVNDSYRGAPEIKQNIQLQLFQIIQDIDAPDVDLEQKYPSLVVDHHPSISSGQSIISTFCKQHELPIENLKLSTRKEVDPRKLLAVKANEDAA